MKKIIIAILLLISITFGWKSISEYSSLKKEDNSFSQMQEEVNISEEKYKKYKELSERNKDFYGWVSIPNTNVDYPVMYTPDDPEKYLHTNFEGEESVAGVPFLDARCTEDSDCMILYGHNMRDKTMFQNILNFKEEEFYKDNNIISFDTLKEEKKYKVMAAFYDKVYQVKYEGFKYYNFIKAENEEEYNEAINYFKENSLYDTGVTAKYGEKLLILTTCSYHQENGRFAIVAKEITE